MKKICTSLLALGVVALTGCSTSVRTPEYSCALETVEAARCASMEQAYVAAKNSSGGTGTQSVFANKPAAAQAQGPVAPVVPSALSAYPEPGQTGMPVFKQPQVMRVWVAPYVDADGNLRSGEYTYFNTPGQWNYGDTKRPGAAAGAFEPSRPSKLGFDPTAPAPRNTGRAPNTTRSAPSSAPTAPAEPSAAPRPAPTSTAPSTAPAAEPSGSITQPYKRLTTSPQ